MLGLHPCIYSEIFDLGGKFLVRYLIQFEAGKHLVFILYYAEILRDGYCGISVVTCDHNDPYACASALFYGILDLRPYRVDHPDESYEYHILFAGLNVISGRSVVIHPVCGSEDSERSVCHGSHGTEDLFLSLLGHGNYAFFSQISAAYLEYFIGSTLRILDYASVVIVYRGHPLSVRIERDLSDPWHADIIFVLVYAFCKTVVHKSILCRLAFDFTF